MRSIRSLLVDGLTEGIEHISDTKYYYKLDTNFIHVNTVWSIQTIQNNTIMSEIYIDINDIII